VSDATVLIRDIAADASQKAANQVRPSEDKLAQIDEPAEENTWHEKPNINKDDIKGKFKKNKTVSDVELKYTLGSFNTFDRTSLASRLHPLPNLKPALLVMLPLLPHLR
jgi:hypothetical protein